MNRKELEQLLPEGEGQCVEEFGEGWDKIIKEHLLKPRMSKIKASESSFHVTVFSTKGRFEIKKETVLNERQGNIISFIKKNGRITTGECASLLKVSNDTALRELSKMVSIGLIERKGIGRGFIMLLSDAVQMRCECGANKKQGVQIMSV